MKLLIASDIHGDAACCKKMLDAATAFGADKIVLLGDLLYHGPRNDLPDGYAPKSVIQMLNEVSDKLICVRGNCEAEVDQMVLSFPVMSDTAWIFDGENNISMLLSHGHKYNPENLPPLPNGTVFLYGHTHVSENRYIPEGSGFEKPIYLINPGSISRPRDASPSYALILIKGDGTLTNIAYT